jgi:nicotinamidase-related amidase
MMNRFTKPCIRTSALVTIDTQQDTLDGQPFEVPGTSAILPRMRKLLDVYRLRSMPIVHIVRIYKMDGSNVDLCRKEAFSKGEKPFLEGGPGCAPAQALFDQQVTLNSDLLLSGKPQRVDDHEIILYKPRWGAFYDTGLDTYLKKCGVDSLAFTGCNFPNCPRASIYEASERDYKIVLVKDAISGLDEQGVQEMKCIGVEIADSKTLIRAVDVLGV